MIELVLVLLGILLFAKGVRLQWRIGRLMLVKGTFQDEWFAPAIAGNFMMPVGIALVITGFLS